MGLFWFNHVGITWGFSMRGTLGVALGKAMALLWVAMAIGTHGFSMGYPPPC